MRNGEFNIELFQSGNITIAAVRGSVDASACERLHDRLSAYCRMVANNVVVDCRDVTCLHRRAVELLMHCHRQCQGSRSRFAVCNLNRQIGDVVSRVDLEETLPVYPTREAALAGWR